MKPAPRPASAFPDNVVRLELPPTDAELVLAARAGRERALDQLFHRYAKQAAGLAYRLLGRDDEVDDIVQDSFAAAMISLHRLKEPQAFAAWLWSIVTRTVTRAIRRRRLLRRLGLLPSPGDVEPSLRIAPDASPEVVAELHAVYRVIDSLPADERVILVLRRVDDLTHQEIAERTGWSVATVKRRLESAETTLARYRDLGGGS